jgi:micrococcal nuclease
MKYIEIIKNIGGVDLGFKSIGLVFLVAIALMTACTSKPVNFQETNPGTGLVVEKSSGEGVEFYQYPVEEQNISLFNVIRVVDGDTIIVDFNESNERVRFIGIDTPETVHPEKQVQPFGLEASQYVKDNLEGKKVGLEFDIQERDRYGRLLAYIWIDGKMLNDELLKEGLAKISTFPPNVKYVERFRRTEEKAREEMKGIWGLEN